LGTNCIFTAAAKGGLTLEAAIASANTAEVGVNSFTVAFPSLLFTNQLIFNNEISDPSNQYNPTTGVFTFTNSGLYEFRISGDVSAKDNNSRNYHTGRTCFT